MTKRERLIELLKDNSYLDVLDDEHWELAAEQLLTNGVIVPPVRVGDVVYLPISHRVIAYEVSTIKYDGDLLKIVTHNKLSGMQRTIWAMDVGETIFRTRAEAERELERRRNENN